jgi:hypothetical protein
MSGPSISYIIYIHTQGTQSKYAYMIFIDGHVNRSTTVKTGPTEKCPVFPQVPCVFPQEMESHSESPHDTRLCVQDRIDVRALFGPH